MSGASSSAIDDVWVYHEKQMSSLCGQHCINNLVQRASYSAADLAEIAHELDAQERQHMLAEGANTPDAIRFLAEESGNVDAAGNFSLQVLNTALGRLYNAHLVSVASESIADKYGGERAFVLNRHAHWVTIREIGGVFWDLNSMLDHPARITTFALEATLHQLRQDGYSVFVVRGGTLPPPATHPGEGARDSWYRVKELLEASRRGTGGTIGTAATDVWLNSGPGQRLDGGGAGASMTEGAAGGSAGGVDVGSSLASEDAQLAMAIRASMQEGGAGDVGVGGEPGATVAVSSAGKGSDVYQPQPVPESPPTGPDVVRVQLRVGDNKKLVRLFRRSDPVSILMDVAAHCLAESDGKPVTASFDLIAPAGRYLLRAGRVVGEVGDGGSAGASCTIGSEMLGGASVLVRRAR